MYSYQFKTALQLALYDPHWAVTYVSFSCSGSVTPQLIDKPQNKSKLQEYENKKEKPYLRPNAAYKKFQPRLTSLRKLLCPKNTNCDTDRKRLREIDYLLVSTGGNDIGFAELVANMVFSHTSWLTPVARIFRKLKKPNADTVKDINGLSAVYSSLRDTLGKRLNIKDCETGKLCDRILLTSYPEVLKDENGEACFGELGEFKVPFGRDKAGARRDRIKDGQAMVMDKLHEVQRNTACLWTVVTDHIKKYEKHGFCAQDKNSASETAEIFTIPVLKKYEGRKQWLYRTPENTWKPFNYLHYRGYESRQRWFRLPVDSKLNINQDTEVWLLQNDWFFIDEIAGIMHPTAEGLAITADANIAEIMKIELASQR